MGAKAGPPASHRMRRSGPGPPLPSEEILDAAFRRAYRVTPHGVSRADRSRRRAQLKLVRSAAVVLRHLSLEIRPLIRPPPTPFEQRLVDQAFGVGRSARAVRRVQHAEARIRRLLQEEEPRLHQVTQTDAIAPLVRRFYGRLASFVREVDSDLELTRSVIRFRRARPHLEPDMPTLVVAGLPNVGKSSLVARLSSARPKVAQYPFTTRSIAVGHADLGFDRMQVVDTPGVLGRASKRNPAEAEAETAVGGAASVVLFVLDPTESCGYPLEDQERLLARWKLEFPKLPFIEVETKGDLLRRSGSGRLTVSATTGEGIRELQGLIQRVLPRRVPVEALAEEPTQADWSVWPVEKP